MLEINEKYDQLQFRQSELVDQFFRFCQVFDDRIDAIASQPNQANADLDNTFLTENLTRLTDEIVQAGQLIRQRLPELADAAVRDFQFLLAAWADEALIKTLGQDRIPMEQQGSMERAIFGTVHAGDEFFNKIVRMLERRNMDDVCLSAAYWLALIQGFEGRYIGGSGNHELRRYVRALQAIALEKIVLQDLPKSKLETSTHQSNSPLNRFVLWVKPKNLLAFSIGLLMLCLLSLEVHWNQSTTQLTQTLKDFSDLRQNNAAQQELK
jgi:type VI protein secretion system component VasF